MHDLITRIMAESAPGARILHRLSHDRLAQIGAIVVLLVILAAVMLPWIAPHDPIRQFAGERLGGPQASFPLGTDQLGRCLLSRLVWGARASLGVALIVVAGAIVIGVPLGLISGYFGGAVDEIIMRVVDILLSFPGIIFAIVVVGVLGPSLLSVMIGLALVHWTSYARVVRGTVLEIKNRLFVEAAEAIGARRLRIMFVHILPHCLGPVLVMATLGMGHVILAAAAMSFLGLGAQPPTPEWGAMLNGARDFIRVAPALMIPPGLAIMITVLSFNLLGDALQDAIEPNGA
ncbi:MAG: nickel transporter permease [Armatimonadota bacterium]